MVEQGRTGASINGRACRVSRTSASISSARRRVSRKRADDSAMASASCHRAQHRRAHTHPSQSAHEFVRTAKPRPSLPARPFRPLPPHPDHRARLRRPHTCGQVPPPSPRFLPLPSLAAGRSACPPSPSSVLHDRARTFTAGGITITPMPSVTSEAICMPKTRVQPGQQDDQQHRFEVRSCPRVQGSPTL